MSCMKPTLGMLQQQCKIPHTHSNSFISAPFRRCHQRKASRTVSASDNNRTATTTQRYHVPKAAVALVTTAYCSVLWGTTGAALAEGEAAQAPAMPPLPSPPEAVRKLTAQFSNDILSEIAPSLTDAKESPSKEKAASSDDNNGAGQDNNAAQDSETLRRNEELRENFEETILPKIEKQLKELDEIEEPNDITIDLRRQLRRAEDDIYRLLRDLRGSKSDAVQAEASGLQRDFADIREYVKRHGGTLVEE